MANTIWTTIENWRNCLLINGWRDRIMCSKRTERYQTSMLRKEFKWAMKIERSNSWRIHRAKLSYLFCTMDADGEKMDEMTNTRRTHTQFWFKRRRPRTRRDWMQTIVVIRRRPFDDKRDSCRLLLHGDVARMMMMMAIWKCKCVTADSHNSPTRNDQPWNVREREREIEIEMDRGETPIETATITAQVCHHIYLEHHFHLWPM